MKISFARRFVPALFILLGFMSANTLRADWSLSGRVTDDKGSPLPGVTIVVVGQHGPAYTKTDKHGRYFLGGLLSGNQTLTVKLEGYGTRLFSCTQSSAADEHFNIILYEGFADMVSVPFCVSGIDTHSPASVTHIPQWMIDMYR